MAHPTKIRHDHRVIAFKPFRERHPHVASLAIAMEQDYGRSFPADAHVNRRTICGDTLDLKVGRKRLDAPSHSAPSEVKDESS